LKNVFILKTVQVVFWVMEHFNPLMADSGTTVNSHTSYTETRKALSAVCKLKPEL
jgi:hypothetical protein